MKFLVCVSGGIASGKTTLAETLCGRQGGIRLAWGDAVRRRAMDEDLPATRESLQDVGLKMVGEGWESFVRELCKDFSRDDADLLVVEGIRHVDALRALKTRFPDRKSIVVFVDIDPELRSERVARRGEMLDALIHPVESDLENVRSAADLVLDGGEPVDTLVDDVVQRLGMERPR